MESGEKRAGIVLHASDSTVGEHSEMRQPTVAPDKPEDETAATTGDDVESPSTVSDIHNESRSSYRLRVRSEAIIMPNALSHLEVESVASPDGPAVVPMLSGFRDGKEWVVPNCVTRVTEGKAIVPVLNLTASKLFYSSRATHGTCGVAPGHQRGYYVDGVIRG